MTFWKVLRVLVSDSCNYRCVFCHNEGQPLYGQRGHFLKLEDFRVLGVALQDSGIVEVQFSGGEPFTNPHTLDMIEWVDAHTTWEIGCATNGQLVTEALARRLSQTRCQVNVNLPAVDQDLFYAVTGTGVLQRLQDRLALFDAYQVNYAYNSVLREGGLDDLLGVIARAAAEGRRLKILPYLDTQRPQQAVDLGRLIAHLDGLSESYSVQPTSRKWVLKDRGRGSSVIKVVDFPCRSSDIRACREYAEIRLLPDLSIQPCLIDFNHQYRLKLDDADAAWNSSVYERFELAWQSFTHC